MSWKYYHGTKKFEKRDKEIVRQHLLGKSYATLGEKYGFHRTHIQRIVKHYEIYKTEIYAEIEEQVNKSLIEPISLHIAHCSGEPAFAFDDHHPFWDWLMNRNVTLYDKTKIEVNIRDKRLTEDERRIRESDVAINAIIAHLEPLAAYWQMYRELRDWKV